MVIYVLYVYFDAFLYCFDSNTEDLVTGRQAEQRLSSMISYLKCEYDKEFYSPPLKAVHICVPVTTLCQCQ